MSVRMDLVECPDHLERLDLLDRMGNPVIRDDRESRDERDTQEIREYLANRENQEKSVNEEGE